MTPPALSPTTPTELIAGELRSWADNRDALATERQRRGRAPLESDLLRLAAERLTRLDEANKEMAWRLKGYER